MQEKLVYNIYKVEGYKIVIYVDNEPYTEIVPGSVEVIHFRYVTGYRDVGIELKLVEDK